MGQKKKNEKEFCFGKKKKKEKKVIPASKLALKPEHPQTSPLRIPFIDHLPSIPEH